MTLDLFSIKKDDRQIIPTLLEKFGLPSIRKDLAIYYKNDDNTQIHLRFRNKKCIMLIIDPDQDELFRPKVHIDTNKTNIKSLLLMLKKMGFNYASVGLATSFSFQNDDDTFVEVMWDTFIGNFVQVGYEDFEPPEVVQWLEAMNLKLIKKSQLETLVKEAHVTYEEAINDLNVINPHIYNFAREIGLDIETPEQTLRNHLHNFNNDYSYIERGFETIFRSKFLGLDGTDGIYHKYFKPVSVIISCYNSGTTYLKTLLSINSQDLLPEQFEKIEVILVDDGSDIPVKTTVAEANLQLKYKTKIIRLEQNTGLANARNSGLSLATNQIVIFLDSDVVLSKNYLFEHSIRNSFIPNAIFVSFKQNIQPLDEVLSDESISNGLNRPNISSDLRVRKIIQNKSLGLYEISGKMAVEILGATNYFKDLSYGRNVGIYDLPAMVIGHNMSSNKKNILSVGAFSNNFKGWGMEDSFFGAKMIAEGNFIIPVLTCGVYHIDHPPRSGSEEKKKQELESNLQKYQQLLNTRYEPSSIR